MFWKKKRISKYDEDISVLADMLISGSDKDGFKLRAQDLSEKYGADDLIGLKKLFHNPPPESLNYDA